MRTSPRTRLPRARNHPPRQLVRRPRRVGPGPRADLPGSAAPLVDPGRMLRKIAGRSVTDLTWWPTGMVVDPAFGLRAGGDGLGLHAGDFCADTGYQAVPRPDGRWVRVAPLSAPCPEGFSEKFAREIADTRERSLPGGVLQVAGPGRLGEPRPGYGGDPAGDDGRGQRRARRGGRRRRRRRLGP